MEKQIALGGQVGKFVNEHFQSNLYRLKAMDIHSHVIPYTFVGRLENFIDDWRYVVDHIPILSPAERAMLLEPVKRMNARPTPKVDDDGTRRKVCGLPATIADVECLGYGGPGGGAPHGCEGYMY